MEIDRIRQAHRKISHLLDDLQFEDSKESRRRIKSKIATARRCLKIEAECMLEVARMKCMALEKSEHDHRSRKSEAS